MAKDIKLRQIANIVNDDHISKIDDIECNVKNIILETEIKEYKILKSEGINLVILNLEDNTGNLCALLVGNNKNEEFNKLVNSIQKNNIYRVKGLISTLNKNMYEDFDNMCGKDINIKKYLFGNKLLCVRGIQNINN